MTKRSRRVGSMRWLPTTLALLSLVLLGSTSLVAQTQFASFTGVVTSKDGSPVPAVDVVATNLATQVKYTARSNNDGLYTISQLISNLSPRAMARQTMAIFSTHDPEDAISRLSPDGIEAIRQFYQGHSSRKGALNDATHTVGRQQLQAISIPALIVHSREDKSVPFAHAEWALQNIPQARLCETGFTGHFIWVDPEYPRINAQMAAFLRNTN